MPDPQTVLSKLDQIETEMQRAGLWQTEPLDPEQYDFRAAFAKDTMDFSQWLQFIFLPRMYALVERSQLPPGPCAILPLAEQYFQGAKLDVRPLLRVLDALDRLISK